MILKNKRKVPFGEPFQNNGYIKIKIQAKEKH